MDRCILLFKHLSNHMQFITNGCKRFFIDQVVQSKAACSFNSKQVYLFLIKYDISERSLSRDVCFSYQFWIVPLNTDTVTPSPVRVVFAGIWDQVSPDFKGKPGSQTLVFFCLGSPLGHGGRNLGWCFENRTWNSILKANCTLVFSELFDCFNHFINADVGTNKTNTL